MDDEVKDNNNKRIRKERYRKFKDDWRYVGCDTWRLDKVSGHYSPEDQWIDSIDNENIITFPPQIALVDWIADVLEEREAKIINDFVWEDRRDSGRCRTVQGNVHNGTTSFAFSK